MLSKVGGSEKRYKVAGGGQTVELFIEGGLKRFSHYAVLCSKSNRLVACQYNRHSTNGYPEQNQQQIPKRLKKIRNNYNNTGHVTRGTPRSF